MHKKFDHKTRNIKKMTEIGKRNKLRVVKILNFGLYLDGEDKGEILLPTKEIPRGTKVDDILDVFVYNDSDDRIIASTKKTYGMVGDFVLLKAKAVDKVGAFLDWGLPKDLLVPFSEQKKKMEKDRSYIVYIFLDEETQRVAASAKVEKFLDLSLPDYLPDEEVDLLIYQETRLGYAAIINNAHLGILYHNEIFQTLKVGKKMKGYVRKVRDDKKIDLYLNKSGYKQIDADAQNILQIIKAKNNFIRINDKSSPEIIYDTFSISKKSFKRAIGNLYKNRLITLEKDGIRLVE